MLLFMGIMLVWTGAYADTSKQATQVVLGGQWFSETETGEKNGYLMSEFKERVFDPIVTRIATHVYENASSLNTLEWFGGAMLGWLLVVTIGVGYGYVRCKKLAGRNPEARQLQERQV